MCVCLAPIIVFPRVKKTHTKKPKLTGQTSSAGFAPHSAQSMQHALDPPSRPIPLTGPKRWERASSFCSHYLCFRPCFFFYYRISIIIIKRVLTLKRSTTGTEQSTAEPLNKGSERVWSGGKKRRKLTCWICQHYTRIQHKVKDTRWSNFRELRLMKLKAAKWVFDRLLFFIYLLAI